MQITIYAYTELGIDGIDYPAFINLRSQDGRYILSVRSRGSESPQEIELTADDMEDLAADMLNHLNPPEDAVPNK